MAAEDEFDVDFGLIRFNILAFSCRLFGSNSLIEDSCKY